MMVRMDRVGFVELFLFIQNRLDDKIELLLAEVVGSNPTQSISYCEGTTVLS
jgi:hypothetical protein